MEGFVISVLRIAVIELEAYVHSANPVDDISEFLSWVQQRKMGPRPRKFGRAVDSHRCMSQNKGSRSRAAALSVAARRLRVRSLTRAFAAARKSAETCATEPEANGGEGSYSS